MPLHGTRLELDAHYYFGSIFRKVVKKNTPPMDIPDLEKLIAKKKDTLKFLDAIYVETFNTMCPVYKNHNFTEKHANFNDYILASISKYENDNDELMLYEKSQRFVFETGEYYTETKEGNHRNWIYCCEIETAYKNLKKEIKNLERKLRQRQAEK
jgi:hypothetical protein